MASLDSVGSKLAVEERAFRNVGEPLVMGMGRKRFAKERFSKERLIADTEALYKACLAG